MIVFRLPLIVDPAAAVSTLGVSFARIVLCGRVPALVIDYQRVSYLLQMKPGLDSLNLRVFAQACLADLMGGELPQSVRAFADFQTTAEDDETITYGWNWPPFVIVCILAVVEPARFRPLREVFVSAMGKDEGYAWEAIVVLAIIL